MPDEPENHTIRLLQEMRTEMRQGFEGVNARIDDTNTRLDGLTHILVLLAANQHQHEERIEKLEGKADD